MTHLVWFVIAVSLLLVINACNPEASTTIAPNQEAALIHQKQQNITEIENNITNSYARLAAQHADICPKLLQRNLDNSPIQRVAEVMMDDYCDYFLYLNAGQHVKVTVDNAQIEALLIVPTLHDFANGEYDVASYDKHVIRLAYNGASYKPERLNYDVTISITDDDPN